MTRAKTPRPVPTKIGERALQPRPLSEARIADLVDRARRNSHRLAAVGIDNLDAACRSQVSRREAPVAVPPTAIVPPQFPPGSTCAICAEPAVGALHREPIARDDALVNVCVTCATEVPREGQYQFGGGRLGAGVGEGNRRSGSRGST